jgi:hypothetical protein
MSSGRVQGVVRDMKEDGVFQAVRRHDGRLGGIEARGLGVHIHGCGGNGRDQ